jgi:hypothetical protein
MKNKKKLIRKKESCNLASLWCEDSPDLRLGEKIPAILISFHLISFPLSNGSKFELREDRF